MKRNLTVIASLLLLTLLSPPETAAQTFKPAPVDVSSQTTTRDGKQYYCHEVLDHQTLFSISRTYGVSYQDILDANPDYDLTRGQIQVGQVLLIPKKDSAPAAAEASVPQPSPATPEASSGEIRYQAKWYEDLDMIAGKFGVDKQTLMAYNGLTSDKIEKRQILRIPPQRQPVSLPAAPAAPETERTEPSPLPTTPLQGTEVALSEPETPVEGQLESNEEEKDTREGFSLWDLFRKKRPSDKIQVGVVLPLNAKGQLNHSAFDLYSGMLLAVRDLSKSGIHAELTVLDTRNAATPLTAQMLEGCDLVLGPISPEELEMVLGLCSRSTAVVSPLDPKAITLAETYPNFIQAPSPTEAQLTDLVAWAREDCLTTDKILLIQEKGVEPTAIARELAATGESFETLTLTQGEARSCAEQIRLRLPARGTGRVLIASDKEGFFNSVLQNLSQLCYKGSDIVLYAPSRVRTFDLVEVENLHRVNAHLSCSYFIDYDNARMKDFLLSYRALFGAEPTQFAYQGYDAALYFIRNFATSERDRERMTRLEERKYRGLQSDFLISDEGGRGHVNRAVRRVVYAPNYSISLLNQ